VVSPMHDDQLTVDEGQVAALIADELPGYAGLPVEHLSGSGTVNAVFRVGGHLTARFPLRPDDPDHVRSSLEREADAADELRLVSPFATPRPVHIGNPGHGYPMPWSAQTWLDGRPATPTSCADSEAFAHDLATLIGALREADTRGRPFDGGGRGGDLTDHDAWMDECLDKSRDLIDTAALRRLWSSYRELPREDPDLMSHTDLIPGNMLVDDDRLVGVLDGGGYRAADPALDLVCAWHVLGRNAREVLRRELPCPDLQWERGKAWAFEQAAGAYWYYQDTNPPMALMGRTTLDRLIAEG
jgi:aminoglycoside phosphotransferase (APT) family kinase protein